MKSRCTWTRNFHWNLEGRQSLEFHEHSESQHERLDDLMDEVAERIRALGGDAAGFMHEFEKLTRLPGLNGTACADDRMEVLLLRDHEAVIQSLRAMADAFGEWGDAGSQDFALGSLQHHVKMAWMLRPLREAFPQ